MSRRVPRLQALSQVETLLDHDPEEPSVHASAPTLLLLGAWLADVSAAAIDAGWPADRDDSGQLEVNTPVELEPAS
jgi:hypothetical protein